MDCTETRSSQGVNSRAFIVYNIYIYILPFPERKYSILEPLSFAHDTSVIISGINFGDFCSVPKIVLSFPYH